MRRYFAAAAAAAWLLGSTSVFAGGGDDPVKLTDEQLEQVTGGDKYTFTFNFILEDVYNSPINTALVLQIAGSGVAYQSATATAVQSVLAMPAGSGGAGAQRAQPNLPPQARRPAHAGR